MTHPILVILGCMVGATLWSFYRNPHLPQQLTAAELQLDLPGETLSFDMAHVRGVCVDQPLEVSDEAALTLDYGDCATRALQLIPLQGDGAAACLPSKGSVVVQVAVPNGDCQARFLLLEGGANTPPRSFPATPGLRIVLKSKASLLGSTTVVAIAAERASAADADATVLLGSAQGQVLLAASAMRLERLAIGKGVLHLDFDEGDMGFVRTAKLNGKNRLARWRFEQFVIALVALLGAAKVGDLAQDWWRRRCVRAALRAGRRRRRRRAAGAVQAGGP